MKKLSLDRIKKVSLILGIIATLLTISEKLGLTNLIKLNENNETVQLTVFVTDDSGNVVLENQGRINIPIGNRSLNEKVGVNGRTNFPDITKRNLGDTLIIGLKAVGWEMVDKDKIHIFNGESITIIVKRVETLGIIKGTVKTRDGQDFISNAEIHVGADTLVYSNSVGQFKTVLPESMRVKSFSDYYQIVIKKKGYNTKTEFYYPNTFLEVRLENRNK